MILTVFIKSLYFITKINIDNIESQIIKKVEQERYKHIVFKHRPWLGFLYFQVKGVWILKFFAPEKWRDWRFALSTAGASGSELLPAGCLQQTWRADEMTLACSDCFQILPEWIHSWGIYAEHGQINWLTKNTAIRDEKKNQVVTPLHNTLHTFYKVLSNSEGKYPPPIGFIAVFTTYFTSP